MAQKKKGVLADELSWYESNKAEWLHTHQGEFALVAGNDLAGFFPSYERALEAGLRKFGVNREFLIKQVVEHEPVFVIY